MIYKTISLFSQIVHVRSFKIILNQLPSIYRYCLSDVFTHEETKMVHQQFYSIMPFYAWPHSNPLPTTGGGIRRLYTSAWKLVSIYTWLVTQGNLGYIFIFHHDTYCGISGGNKNHVYSKCSTSIKHLFVRFYRHSMTAKNEGTMDSANRLMYKVVGTFRTRYAFVFKLIRFLKVYTIAAVQLSLH